MYEQPITSQAVRLDEFMVANQTSSQRGQIKPTAIQIDTHVYSGHIRGRACSDETRSLQRLQTKQRRERRKEKKEVVLYNLTDLSCHLSYIPLLLLLLLHLMCVDFVYFILLLTGSAL